MSQGWLMELVRACTSEPMAGPDKKARECEKEKGGSGKNGTEGRGVGGGAVGDRAKGKSNRETLVSWACK